jgi:uncharacterized protein DUF3147
VKPTFDPKGLEKTKSWEYVVRFAFGGLVTAGTGLIARRYGPVVGGLFLAFPAILPASLTLVQQHDGREQAVEDARGARLGSIGLAAFALVTWRIATTLPGAPVIVVATLAWALVSVAAWALRYGPPRSFAVRGALDGHASRSPRSR